MSRPLSPYLIGVPHLPEHLLALLDDRARRPLTPAEERECDEHLGKLKCLIRERRASNQLDFGGGLMPF